MKKLKYIVSFLCIAAMTSSCEKFLDTKPTDSLSPEFYYATEAQINTALTGVYDILGDQSLYGEVIFTRVAAPSDLTYYRRNNSFTGTQVLNYDAADNDIRQMWRSYYSGINRANLVLENIDKPEMTDEARNVIKGQALFLRGYYYFMLVSNWGDVPVSLSSKVDITKSSSPRVSSAKVYAQVLKDMEEAEPLVKGIREYGFGGRVSKSAVRGILARVNLYMAGAPLNDVSRYPEALKWAKMVKDDAVANHKLNPSFSDVFIRYASDKYDVNESIWEVENFGNRIGNAYVEAGRVGNTNGVQCGDFKEGYSYGFIGMTKKLYNLYEATDVRRDWSIAPYSYVGQTAVKKDYTAAETVQRMNGKFRREYEVIEKQKNFTPENFPLLRYADVLLMLAEAENAVNGVTTVGLDAINLVRARASATQYNATNANVPASKGDFLNIIQDERARELSGEALRINDLKRWGLYLFVMKQQAAVIKATYGTTYSYAALAGDNISERHLLYPIPLRELALNPALTQNKNW